MPAVPLFSAVTAARPATRPAAAKPTLNGTGRDMLSLDKDAITQEILADGKDVLNQGSTVVSLQCFVAGTMRAIGLLGRFSATARAVGVAADAMDGQAGAIYRIGDKLVTGSTRAVSTVAPRLGAGTARVVAPLTHAFGFTVRAVAKAAPVLSVIAAAWDVTKAATEPNPAARRTAWANAGLSVVGAGLGVGAAILGATPVGWGLAIGSAAIAGFQLYDTWYANGDVTRRLAKGLGL